MLLHAGLLAALLLGQSTILSPPLSQPAISLLLQQRTAPAGQNKQVNAVRPKPPEIPAERPAAAPAVIAGASRPLPAVPHQQRLTASFATKPAAAPAAAGFVAARPVPGDVDQPPEYPAAAIAHGEQGQVLLSIHVLPNGQTDFVSVTQSSGYRTLDQAAADAVMKWRFQPATKAGKPMVMVIPFRFYFDLYTQTARPASAPAGP